jgi:hypothetical protein
MVAQKAQTTAEPRAARKDVHLAAHSVVGKAVPTEQMWAAHWAERKAALTVA